MGLIDDFLEYLKVVKKHSSLTIDNYKIDLYNFYEYTKGNFNINKEIINNYLNKLYEEKLSKSTISRKLSALRTFNKYFPFPEEMNRKLTGSLADLHFAPTKGSKNNLLREGIDEKNIYVTGNTVIDAMLHTVEENYVFENDELNKIDFENKKVIMITAHRRENWGQGIENICTALNRIVDENPNVELVYLVHLNPVVKDVVFEKLGNNERIHLLSPLDTKETHNLMNKSYMIMTDSGGLQEEAPHLGKPVLVLRDVTERPEAVEAGTVKLVGTDIEKIVKEANQLINNKEAYSKMSKAINPYGDGNASQRIVNAILKYFNLRTEDIKEFI